jgi:hypothetical protein
VGVGAVAVVKAMDLLLQCGDLMTKINRGIKVLNQCLIFEGLGYLGPETWTSLETKAESTIKGPSPCTLGQFKVSNKE